MYGRESDTVWSETLAIGRPSWSTSTPNGIYVARYGSWSGGTTSTTPLRRTFVIRDSRARSTQGALHLLFDSPLAREVAWILEEAFAHLDSRDLQPKEHEPVLKPYGIMSRADTRLRMCPIPVPSMRLTEHRPPCRVRPTRKAFRGLRARPGARGVLRRCQKGGDDHGEERQGQGEGQKLLTRR